MKRLWIFLLVGPLIVLVCSLFAGYGELLATPYVLPLLIIVYVAGAIPALLTCAVDHFLSDKLGVFKRAAVTSLAGSMFAAAVYAAYFEKVDWGAAAVGLAGAIAGLICSLASSATPK